MPAYPVSGSPAALRTWTVIVLANPTATKVGNGDVTAMSAEVESLCGRSNRRIPSGVVRKSRVPSPLTTISPLPKALYAGTFTPIGIRYRSTPVAVSTATSWSVVESTP